MQIPFEWIEKLKNHDYFKSSKSNFSTKNDNIFRNILAFRQGSVYLWDEKTLNLLNFQLKNLLAEPNKPFLQHITWISPPRFEVESILLSGSNNLALYGSDGIQVIFLPSNKQSIEASASVSCNYINIDEHFFATSGHKLVHLKFHPGFSSPDVLFVLTSNNFIRIYSTDQPQEPLSIINLQPLSPVPLTHKSMFGDSFISFDFSEMLELQTQSSFVPAWQVYLLMASGQVFYSTVVFDGVNTFRFIQHGAMRMYPRTDDNYGFDACSLLHLATTPPVLVVATSDGQLHQSLILNASAFDEDDVEKNPEEETCGENDGRWNYSVNEADDGDRSFLKTIQSLSASFNQSGKALSIDNKGIISNRDNQKVLYVYETIELECRLNTPSLTTSNDEYESCRILLQKDASNKYRYHCIRPAGIHCVLPMWLPSLEHHFSQDCKDEQWESTDQTIVENLLCISPLPTDEVNELVGFTQIFDPFLGNHLITLDSHYTLNTIPLLKNYKLETHELKVQSSLCGAPCTPYEHLLGKISRMLTKDVTNPILTGSRDTKMDAEECFGLLCRATQVFRTEYIAKYDLVRVELDKNVARLEKIKARQLAELERLEKVMNQCKEDQENIKKKLYSDNQYNLSNRINKLAYNAEKGIEVLSNAETSALHKLKELQNTSKNLFQKLDLLKKRCAYNNEVIDKECLKRNSLDIPKEKSATIKQLLEEEGEKILMLMKDLKKAQISSGL